MLDTKQAQEQKWQTINLYKNRKTKKETMKAHLFSIPENNGLYILISKKCIHGSRSGNSFAVGIKLKDEYKIWNYDKNIKMYIKNCLWLGEKLIKLYKNEWDKIIAGIEKNKE